MLTGCPFCDHKNNSLHREKQALKDGGSRNIYKCNECGILYPEFRMDNNESADYMIKYSTNEEEFKSDPKAPIPKNDPTVEFASVITNKGKALDVGTFDGRFTYMLESIGFDAYGMEYQEKAVEFAQKNGLKVYKGTFPDDIPENLLGQKYTLICLTELICYLNDLKKSLWKAYEMLEDNGFLLVKCHQGNSRYYTHAGNSYFKRFGDNVQGIPTVDSLLYCLKQTGFMPFQCGGVTESYHYKSLQYTQNDMQTADRLIFLSQKQPAK